MAPSPAAPSVIVSVVPARLQLTAAEAGAAPMAVIRVQLTTSATASFISLMREGIPREEA
jgi:hypothetical protein